MERLRIILFTQQFSHFRSGVGTYSAVVTQELVERGHGVTLVTPDTEEAPSGLPIRTIKIPRRKLDPTPGGWFSLGISFARILSLEAGKFDLAYFTDAREAWAFNRSSIPLIGMINDSYALDWEMPNYPRSLFLDKKKRGIYYKFLRATEKRTYHHFQALIANSHYVAETVTKGYDLNPSLLHVVYIGLPDLSEITTPMKLDGHPSILFVGGNFQRKGLLTLIQAVSELITVFPQIKLHIVGSDRNQSAFEKQCFDLGISSSVLFHGWKPNDYVCKMIAGARIFAMPSFTEGFGLVYLEAIRAGTPVIASVSSGIAEILRDRIEALFVRRGDVSSLVHAIRDLESDQTLRKNIIAKSRKVLEGFSVKEMTKKTEKIFSSTLQNCRRVKGKNNR